MITGVGETHSFTQRPSSGPLSLPPHLLRGPTTGPQTSPLCLLTSTFIYSPTCPFTFSRSLFFNTWFTWFSHSPSHFFNFNSILFCTLQYAQHRYESKISLRGNKWISFIFICSNIVRCVCISSLHKYRMRHMLCIHLFLPFFLLLIRGGLSGCWLMTVICQGEVDKTVNIIFVLRARAHPTLPLVPFISGWTQWHARTRRQPAASRSILITSLLGHQLPLIRPYIFIPTSEREREAAEG